MPFWNWYLFALALPTVQSWQYVNATWLNSAVRHHLPTHSPKPLPSTCHLSPSACTTLAHAAATSFDPTSPTLIVTCLDHHLMEMYHNWVCALNALRLTHVVFALDEVAYRTLSHAGAPVIRFNPSASPASTSTTTAPPNRNRNRNESIHGTTQFARLTYKKLQVVRQMLRAGYHALYSDVDVILLRNPFTSLPVLREGKLKMIFANDWSMTHHQYQSNKHLQYLCTGFFYARSHPKTVHVLDQALRFGELPGNLHRDDQIAINAVLPQSTWHNANRTVAMIGMFEGTDVVNGYTYYHQMIPQQLHYQPVAVHANYILGKENKRKHMMVHGLWTWLPRSKKCRGLNEKSGKKGIETETPVDTTLHGPPVPQTVPQGNQTCGNDGGSTALVVLTCSTSIELLSNFESHYSRNYPNHVVCPVHVNQKHSTFQLIGATASMTEPCPSILAHARTLLSTATAATTTLKCRQLRPMLLSAALNIDSPGSHRGGFFPKHVLWLNAGVLFVKNPSILVSSDYQHFDVLMSSSWQPRKVVATSTAAVTTLRMASTIAQHLRALTRPVPLPSLDVFFIRKNNLTKSLIQPYRSMEIQLLQWVGRRCRGGCPGSFPFVSRCVWNPATIGRRESLQWGVLDPLVYVNSKYYTLSWGVHVNVPHALRYQPRGGAPVSSQKIDMLVDGVWKVAAKKGPQPWRWDWKELSLLKGWSMNENDGSAFSRATVQRIWSRVPNHTEHPFVCVLKQGKLIDPIVPMAFLTANQGTNPTVHYFMEKECKERNGKNYVLTDRCAVVQRFIARRVPHPSYDIVYHHTGQKQGAPNKIRGMEALVKEVSKSYPYVKCDVVLIDQKYKELHAPGYEHEEKSGATSTTLPGLLVAVQGVLKTGGVVEYF